MLIQPFQVAIFAFVFCNILMQYGQIFHQYWQMLDNLVTKTDLDWLAKPLGHCDICFCGQVSLWFAFAKYGPSLEVLLLPINAIFILFVIKKLIYNE
jgi:hypothetical protein